VFFLSDRPDGHKRAPSEGRWTSFRKKGVMRPRRPRNADLWEGEYLTPKEVDRLEDAVRKHSRYGHRDATAILIAFMSYAPANFAN